MSITKVEDPSVVETATGYTSYWVAAYNYIRFKYQRQDVAFVSVTDIDGYARFDISYINPAPGISPMTGDVIYVSGNNYSTTCIIAEIQDITVSGHSSIGLVTDLPYNGNETGYVNDITEKANWRMEVIIQKYIGSSYTDIAKANYRALPNGLIWVEAQEFIKGLLNNNYTYVATGLSYTDEYNSATFSLKYRERYNGYDDSSYEQENNFFAVNAAMQTGQLYAPNLANYVAFDTANQAKFLSCFKEPTYWHGYPFALSFIYHEEAAEYTYTERWFDINKEQVDIALQGPIQNEIKKINYLGTQRLTVSNYPFSYTSLRLNQAVSPYNAVSEEKMIRVKTACPTKEQIYLVWKNQLGGWDYYLFDSGHISELTIEEGDLFNPWVEDLTTPILKQKPLNKNTIETIKLGVGNIDLNDLNGIKGILKSPAVYILEPTSPFNTIEVSVMPGTWVINDSKLSRYDIEFSIRKSIEYNQHN